jgi:hypothetical protein
MSEPRTLRCYQYVNRPYERVRPALRDRGLDIFRHATSSASARADALASTLRVQVAGLEVGVDVHIHVGAMRDEPWIAGLSPVTRIEIGWEAARATGFFPTMKAVLSVWPLTATETQLEIEGTYEVPMGVVGGAIDSVLGHRIAEAAVHRFIDDVVEELKRELPPN